jgi:hypothetical protein
MKYQVTTFNVEIRFKDGRAEVIDMCSLRKAIERQVHCSLSEELVYVLPLDPITREVIECDYCNEIDREVTEQYVAIWNEGSEDEPYFTTLEHVCKMCRAKHSELKDQEVA